MDHVTALAEERGWQIVEREREKLLLLVLLPTHIAQHSDIATTSIVQYSRWTRTRHKPWGPGRAGQKSLRRTGRYWSQYRHGHYMLYISILTRSLRSLVASSFSATSCANTSVGSKECFPQSNKLPGSLSAQATSSAPCWLSVVVNTKSPSSYKRINS